MQKKTGIFIVRKDRTILLCHPTNHPDNHWGIPKGNVDENEHLEEAAVREVLEETGINLSGWRILHHLQPVSWGKNVLYGFVYLEEQNGVSLDNVHPVCHSTFDWYGEETPEVDDFRWVGLNEAQGTIINTQKPALAQVIQLIDKLDRDKIKYKSKLNAKDN